MGYMTELKLENSINYIDLFLGNAKDYFPHHNGSSVLFFSDLKISYITLAIPIPIDGLLNWHLVVFRYFIMFLRV